MSGLEVKMIIPTTDNLDESIGFLQRNPGHGTEVPRRCPLRRALDGGAGHTGAGHRRRPPDPRPGGGRDQDRRYDGAAKAIEEAGGGIVKGPYDDAHERRAVVYDNKGNGIVFYSPLNR